jgi:hypothetical protein
LANFISQYQHDDEVVHRLALLSHPQSKKWSEIDLEVDKFLSGVLIRFTIKIKGKKKLHFRKSIHIKIHLLSREMVKRRQVYKPQ